MMTTKIQWADHTFNPWIGCTKVSAGCHNCYAEATMDKWLNKAKWGPNGTRVKTVASNWKKVSQWDTRLNDTGRRESVFIASLADVFEKNDKTDIAHWRFDLWNMIEKLQNLDFLLLTKRPENILDCTPYTWHNQDVADQTAHWDRGPVNVKWPNHIWLGTSAEDQQNLDERLPWLLKTPASVRFLSLEPLLGPINLHGGSGVIGGHICSTCSMVTLYDENGQFCPYCGRSDAKTNHYIGWVIIGGESGPHARPLDLDWVRGILAQCKCCGIPAFVKQLGSHWAKRNGAAHRKGGDPAEWPERLRVRMMPGDVWV